MTIRHFLNLTDAGADGIAAILADAIDRKAARAGLPKGAPDADAPLAGRALAMVFEKNSTRTRFSFDMAIRQLGGTPIVADAGTMQIGRGETIADTARAGGVVVFRGFPNNSMKLFTQAIARVVERQDEYDNIGIDPRLFRAFEVRAVPTYVVVSSDFDLCAGFSCRTAVPPFDRIIGNVTVDYALSTFAEGGGPGAAVARVGLANLRKTRP